MKLLIEKELSEDEKELSEEAKTFCEDVLIKLYRAVDYMVCDYDRRDLERNLRNAGAASACAAIFIAMGHEVDLKIYNKDGYDLTDQIIIDGKSYDFFHN